MSSLSVSLLWIIPILAFGVFLFLVAWFAENRAAAKSEEAGDNAETTPAEPAAQAPLEPPADSRLGEIEGKLGTLTSALKDQQDRVDKFQRENLAYATQVNKLKSKRHRTGGN